ncbi:hypothetical protein [Rickettsia endosymbiont of Urophora cardui]|uniref:hypothetical protein n=1 Tax=Rickettsia endosymbiont of Urophora cardui TaxID=3066265 RepID=UPI00313D9705
MQRAKDVIAWLVYVIPTEALLRESKNVLGVIPWLVHGIQKTVKNTNTFSILSWIPQSSCGMTEGNQSTQQQHQG